jgi:site-specific recombinase XerD
MQATDILISLFNQFKKEKNYLSNLSERTLHGYQEAFDKWQKHIGEMPSEFNVSMFVIEMRESGLSDVSCNVYIRSINSFLTWLKEKNHIPQTFSNGNPFKIQKLSEEKKQLRVFDDTDISKILSFKPKGRMITESMRSSAL